MPHLPTLERFRVAPHLVAAAITGLLASLSAGCSGNAREQAPTVQQQPIAGGTVDTLHQNVFLLASHQERAGAMCTATLIAPNLLLTARHCVSPGNGDDHVLCGEAVLGEPYPPSAFITTNDTRPSEGSRLFTAAEVRVPDEGTDTCGYDIALIILSNNVPAEISVPAVPRIDREVVPGESYTAVGYGLDENGNESRRRMQLPGLVIDCEPGSCGEGVESTEFRGETGICSGDSGGPALDVDGKVVGVVSRGGPDCSTPVYGSVTAWRDFLIDTATDSASRGGYTVPFWVTTRSSDPPAVVDPESSGSGGASTEASAADATCHSSAECGSGNVCYLSGPGQTGTCAKTCSSTADCASGQFCDSAGNVSVCAAPKHSADESSGCAVTKTGSRRGPLGAIFSLIIAGLALARRRPARAPS